MRRIKHVNTTPTLPTDTSTGTVGHFTNSPATPLTQEWCNSVQGELYSFLSEAGLSESQTDMTQCVTVAKNLKTQTPIVLNGHMGFSADVLVMTAIANDVFPARRWKYNKSGSVVHTTTVDQTSGLILDENFTNASLKIDTTTANASPAAGDYAYLVQHIESENIKQLGSNPFVISFWVKAPTAGTYNVALTNQGTGSLPSNVPTKSYVATFTVTAANTLQLITINVPALPSWDFSTTIGLSLKFVLNCGSTLQTATPNTWLTGHFISSTGSANASATVSTFMITNIQIEKGVIATKYVKPMIGLEIVAINLYSNYYNASSFTTSGINATSGTAYEAFFRYSTPMRTAPTITLVSNIGNTTSFPATIGTVTSVSEYGFTESRTAVSTANNQRFQSKWIANAEIYGV